MRNLTPCVFAMLLFAAGCASSASTYSVLPPPSNAALPPSAPSLYATAPRAPLHSELFVCNTWSSNLGDIGQRGEALNYTPYMDTQAGPLLRMPTEAACFSSGFGWRGVANGGGRAHNGIDLANPNGGFIFAAGSGRIVSADWRNGFGNLVEIDHGSGVHTLYAHLAEIDPNLNPGARVSGGQAIGRMGMTGNATGVHLHYEVWINGLQVDPIHYGLPPQYVTTPVTDDTPKPIDEY